MCEPDRPRVLERVEGRLGELVLRSDRGDFEVISNGVFLMDTRGGASERLLVRAALDRLDGPARLLLGGLGVGFSLAEALATGQVERVTVVEIEPAVVEWNRTHLAARTGDPLSDRRVEVVVADLVEWLGASGERFGAICLDVDNGPGWTVAERNLALYGDAGLALLRERLLPGGALGVWSAGATPEFEARLRNAFKCVERFAVQVPRGEPDVVYAASRD
jgi:spermidine synthase